MATEAELSAALGAIHVASSTILGAFGMGAVAGAIEKPLSPYLPDWAKVKSNPEAQKTAAEMTKVIEKLTAKIAEENKPVAPDGKGGDKRITDNRKPIVWP